MVVTDGGGDGGRRWRWPVVVTMAGGGRWLEVVTVAVAEGRWRWWWPEVVAVAGGAGRRLWPMAVVAGEEGRKGYIGIWE